MIRALALLVLVMAAVPAAAQQNASIEVDRAWARATPPGASEGSVYLHIVNLGATADRLIGASTPVATTASLRELAVQQGLMAVRLLPSLSLPPRSKVHLRPGHDHIMLVGLTRPLKRGDTFPLTLRFAHAGTVRVTVTVESVAARRMEPGLMNASHMDTGGGLGNMGPGTTQKGH